MRTYLIITTLLFASLNPVSAQKQDSLKVRQTLLSMENAWNRGDTAAFVKPYQYKRKKQTDYSWYRSFGYYFIKPQKKNMGHLRFDSVWISPKDADGYRLAVIEWILERKEGNLNGRVTFNLKQFSTIWKFTSEDWIQYSGQKIPEFLLQSDPSEMPPEVEDLE